MNSYTRILDLVISIFGLFIIFPFLLLIGFFIKIDSRGPVFYKQIRIGKGVKPFRLWKFRTMSVNSDKSGLLTVGMDDTRITSVGKWLRKYKLDEIPQLFNVIKNDMSLVGPRPEVPKYVSLYSEKQKKVLTVKPGITDYASIEYLCENELLKNSINPEKTYIEVILPSKIELNMKYIEKPVFKQYIYILFLTLKKIVMN